MAEHRFILEANWPGLRNDVGKIQSGNLQTQVSIPMEMEGPGIGTNPDEMLLGAAATCYIITLAAILEKRQIDKISLTMQSEGIVDVTKGVITYKKIIHRPKLTLTASSTEHDLQLAKKFTEKAEASCMISRALRGNVEIEVEATIIKNED